MVRLILVTLAVVVLTASQVLAASDNNPPGSQNSNANSNSNSNSAQGGQGGQGGNGGNGGNGGQGGNGTGSANSNNSVNMSTSYSSTDRQVFMGAPAIGAAPGILAIPPQDPKQTYTQSPILRPGTMTYEQAQACRKSWLDDEYEGARSESETRKVDIMYIDHVDNPILDMNLYLGTVSVNAPEGYTWLPALCEAAFRAIENGATMIVVQTHVRPINVTKGVGFGSGVGGSVVPNATQNPYTVGASAGFGLGVSSVKIETELHIVAVALHDHNAHFHEAVKTSTLTFPETDPEFAHLTTAQPKGFASK